MGCVSCVWVVCGLCVGFVWVVCGLCVGFVGGVVVWWWWWWWLWWWLWLWLWLCGGCVVVVVVLTVTPRGRGRGEELACAFRRIPQEKDRKRHQEAQLSRDTDRPCWRVNHPAPLLPFLLLPVRLHRQQVPAGDIPTRKCSSRIPAGGRVCHRGAGCSSRTSSSLASSPPAPGRVRCGGGPLPPRQRLAADRVATASVVAALDAAGRLQ